MVDGDQQRDYLRAGPPDGAHAFDVIAGVIHEWCASSEITATKTEMVFPSLANVGQISRQYTDGLNDFLHFVPKPDPGFDLPTSYQGTSGVGAWRLYIDPQPDGTWTLRRRDLVGAAFYQEGDDVICHGPSSIYAHLRDAVLSG